MKLGMVLGILLFTATANAEDDRRYEPYRQQERQAEGRFERDQDRLTQQQILRELQLAREEQEEARKREVDRRIYSGEASHSEIIGSVFD